MTEYVYRDWLSSMLGTKFQTKSRNAATALCGCFSLYSSSEQLGLAIKQNIQSKGRKHKTFYYMFS